MRGRVSRSASETPYRLCCCEELPDQFGPIDTARRRAGDAVVEPPFPPGQWWPRPSIVTTRNGTGPGRCPLARLRIRFRSRWNGSQPIACAHRSSVSATGGRRTYRCSRAPHLPAAERHQRIERSRSCTGSGQAGTGCGSFDPAVPRDRRDRGDPIRQLRRRPKRHRCPIREAGDDRPCRASIPTRFRTSSITPARNRTSSAAGCSGGVARCPVVPPLGVGQELRRESGSGRSPSGNASANPRVRPARTSRSLHPPTPRLPRFHEGRRRGAPRTWWIGEEVFAPKTANFECDPFHRLVLHRAEFKKAGEWENLRNFTDHFSRRRSRSRV